jgi:hypothetical protein
MTTPNALSLNPMPRRSPTLEGFSTLFRLPALGLAEITWRWMLGAAFVAANIFAFVQFLNTLPVSTADLLLLRTRHPLMVSRALTHILAGSGFRALAAALVLALSFSAAWVIVAAIGRAITLKALLTLHQSGEVSVRVSPLIGLNLLRVALTFAALIGLRGGLLLAAMVSPKTDPSPGSAMLIFLLVAMLLGFCWTVLNWFFSLAAICVALQSSTTFKAVPQAVDLFRDRTGPILAVSIWFGLAHAIAFVVAISVVAFPLAFINLLPGGVVLGGVILVTLLYFAVADYLYAGRLAAYVYIAENPDSFAQVVAAPPGSSPNTRLRNGIDQDELILSDLPLGNLPA